MGPFDSCETRPIHAFHPRLEGGVKTLRARDVVTLCSEMHATKGDLVTLTVQRLEADTTKDVRYYPPAVSRIVHIVSRAGTRYRIGSSSWTVVSIDRPWQPFPTEANAVIAWSRQAGNFGDSAQRLGETDSWYMTGDTTQYTSAGLREKIGDNAWWPLVAVKDCD